MTATDLAEGLGAVAPTARILTEGGVDGYEVDGLRPAAVALPAGADEVAALLRFASARDLAVTPRGGGTMIDLGNPPARLDLVIDLSRLDSILEHRPQDLTATVEAGITIGALQRSLAEQGQMLALDPPLAGRATVGGVLATNAGGPRRQRYGTARDLLIGSRAALADGTRIRAGGKVVKNVAGYDLNKLLIGSLGTIGVITEATFKLTPLPAATGMLVACFDSLERAHAMALEVARGRLSPLTLDLIGPPAARRLTANCRAEPGEGHWLLAAELGGAHVAVERATRELVHLAAAAGSPEVTALEREQREALLARLRDFGRSTDDPAALILRASVLPSQVVIATRTFEAASGDARPVVIARVGSGIIHAHWDAAPIAGAATLVERARRGIQALGGSLVVERAPVSVKREVDVWGIEGEDVALMRRIKDAYDPERVLSPGRLLKS